MSRKLMFNSVSGVILYAVNIIITFIMSPVLIRTLGNRDYGFWELIMNLIGYMGLLDLGVGASLVRFVSVADAKNDKVDLQKTISTAFCFFSLISLSAVCLILFLANYPEIVLGHEAVQINNLCLIFSILAFDASIRFPMQVFTATLMGLQYHYFINNVRMLLTISRAFIIYSLLVCASWNGLVALALIESLFTLVQMVLFMGAIHKNKEIPRMSFNAISLDKAKEMIAFASKSAIMLIASRLRDYSIPLLIGNILGLSKVVFFVIPSRLVTYAKNMSEAIGFPLTPYFSATYGKGDAAELYEKWIVSSFVLQVISLSVPIILFFNGSEFISLWLGSEYSVGTEVVLKIMLVGLFIDSIAANAFRMLVAQNKHGKCSLVLLIMSLGSIICGIIGAYSIGLHGAVAATTIFSSLMSFYTLKKTCNVMRISIVAYLKHTLYRIITPLIILAISSYLLSYINNFQSYMMIVINVTILGLIYIISLWLLTFNEVEKNTLISIIKKPV